MGTLKLPAKWIKTFRDAQYNWDYLQKIFPLDSDFLDDNSVTSDKTDSTVYSDWSMVMWNVTNLYTASGVWNGPTAGGSWGSYSTYYTAPTMQEAIYLDPADFKTKSSQTVSAKLKVMFKGGAQISNATVSVALYSMTYDGPQGGTNNMQHVQSSQLGIVQKAMTSAYAQEAKETTFTLSSAGVYAFAFHASANMNLAPTVLYSTLLVRAQ